MTSVAEIPKKIPRLDLHGAFIRRVDLSGAIMRGANLSSADASGADFREADLAGADLTGTILRGADLSTALNLTEEQLAKATIDEETRLPPYLDGSRLAEAFRK